MQPSDHRHRLVLPLVDVVEVEREHRRHGERGGDEGERRPAEGAATTGITTPTARATSYARIPVPVESGRRAVTTLTERTRSPGSTT